MRKYLFALLVSVLFVCMCFAAGQTGAGGILVGSKGLPPTAYGGGLVRSPNPLNQNGNLLMTGNVRYGRYFRGGVPYNSPSSIHANLGTTELDSFMRDSAGSDSWKQYGTSGSASDYYYSGTGTVPTMTPGRSGVFKPSDSRLDQRATDVYGMDALAAARAQAGTSVKPGFKTDTFTSSKSLDALLMSDVVAQENSQDQTKLSDKNFQTWREKVTEQFKPVEMEKLKTDELDQQQPVVPGELTSKTDIEKGDKYIRQMNELRDDPLMKSQTKQETSVETKSDESRMEGIEPMKKLSADEILARIRKEVTTEQVKTEEQSTDDVVSQENVTAQTNVSAMSTGGLQNRYYNLYGTDRANKVLELSGEMDDMDKLEIGETNYNFNQQKTALEQIQSMSREDLEAEAREIMGPYKDMDSYKEAKFKEKFREAAGYLREGMYYRAADTFAMAAIYMPDHPAADVGRSLALFAAGEYVSSSLFLSRALAAKPEYARSEIDLITALGGRDKLDTRVADLERWLIQSEAGELEYLLAYIYYRMGRISKAQVAITAAARRMENKKAADALKSAIEQAAAAQPQQ